MRSRLTPSLSRFVSFQWCLAVIRGLSACDHVAKEAIEPSWPSCGTSRAFRPRFVLGQFGSSFQVRISGIPVDLAAKYMFYRLEIYIYSFQTGDFITGVYQWVGVQVQKCESCFLYRLREWLCLVRLSFWWYVMIFEYNKMSTKGTTNCSQSVKWERRLVWWSRSGLMLKWRRMTVYHLFARYTRLVQCHVREFLYIIPNSDNVIENRMKISSRLPTTFNYLNCMFYYILF